VLVVSALVETTVARFLLLEVPDDILLLLSGSVAVGAAERFCESVGRIVVEMGTDVT